MSLKRWKLEISLQRNAGRWIITARIILVR